METTTTESSREGSDSPRTSAVSSLANSMPNVFVIPPEEEQIDTPPWCCFDADKDAQNNDAYNLDLDYSAHADFSTTAIGPDSFLDDGVVDESSSEGNIFSTARSRVDRKDVFAMRSLMEEAESLKEQLRSLDLTIIPRAPVSSSASEQLSGNSDPVLPEAFSSSSKTRRSGLKLFAFKAKGRKKEQQNAFAASESVLDLSSNRHSAITVEVDDEDKKVYEVINHPVETELHRKPSFFARKFRMAPKRGATETTLYPGSGPGKAASLDARRSSTEPRHQRSFEISSTSNLSSDQRVLRRFSFFEMHRRFSTSSQSTVPTFADQSSSSLETSTPSPVTPSGGECDSMSSPSAPRARSKTLSTQDSCSSMSSYSTQPPTEAPSSVSDHVSLLRSVAPSSSNSLTEVSISLDPLHFESLEFNSDDFF